VRLAVLVLPAVVAIGFAAGRLTEEPPAVAAVSAHVYSGHVGDGFVVPDAATRCTVGNEGGNVDVICSHMPLKRARYEVAFYRDGFFVLRRDTGAIVFRTRGTP
jgi:hypothetical protein